MTKEERAKAQSEWEELERKRKEFFFKCIKHLTDNGLMNAYAINAGELGMLEVWFGGRWNSRWFDVITADELFSLKNLKN